MKKGSNMEKRNTLIHIIKLFIKLELVIWFLVPILFIALLGFNHEEKHLLAMSNVSQICIFIFAIYNMRKDGSYRTCEVEQVSFKKWFKFFVAFAVLVVANSFMTDGYRLVKIGLTDNLPLADQHETIEVGQFLIQIACYAVLPAVCEEFFYRKMIYEKMFFYKKSYILILSGILFAVAHLSVDKMIPMFIMGCLLMLVYADTKNIVGCIILHLLYNIEELIFTYVYTLPSDVSWISYKYPSGVECTEAGAHYCMHAIILYLVLYWILCERQGQRPLRQRLSEER